MNFSKVYLLLLLICLQRGYQCQSNLKVAEGQARQNSFIEWLASLFQFPPLNGNVGNITPPPLTTSAPTEAKNCQPCSCGTPNVIKRIVGGEETQEIRYPWMALLKYNNRFYCGGSLVSDQHVLTAGHCLRGFSSFAISVSLLVHDRTANSSREVSRKAKRVYVHERYSPYNIDNDIGIIQLEKPVEMSNVLRPVCMPQANETFEGKTGIVSGWGALSEGGPLAQKLMQVSVPIISNEQCEKNYGANRITKNMMCAGVPEGNKDACQGDSGGPFHVHNEQLDVYHLAGIVSWGEGCARPDRPGVYTRVTQYLDWVEKKAKNACRCDMPSKKLAEEINWEQ